MPESNYEERLRELDRRYEEQVRIARRNLLTNKLTIIAEELPTIERQIEEAKARNNRIIEERNKELNELHGEATSIGSVFERDIDSTKDLLVPVTVTDEFGNKEELIPVSKEEIERLEEVQRQLLEKRRQFEDERREVLEEINRENNERKVEIIDREEQIKQAYEFFTYMDTATSKGYDVSHLTESEVLDLYNEFYNKKHEPGYQRIWDETNERMLKGDREIIWPKSKVEKEKPQVSSRVIEEELTPEPIIKEEIKPIGLKEEEIEPVTTEDLNKKIEKPVVALENPIEEEITKPIIETNLVDELEQEEELIEGKKSNKGKLAKFKEWAKRNKKKLLVAGLVVGGIIITGSILAGLVACGAVNNLDPNLLSTTSSSTPVFDNVSDIMMPDTGADAHHFVEEYLTPENQTVDFSVGPENNEFFTNSADASQGIDAVEANTDVGPFQVADLNNPTTGEYAGIDPNSLTMEQLDQLKADGYTVPAYTNDPSLVGLNGEQLAEQGQISGFGKSL